MPSTSTLEYPRYILRNDANFPHSYIEVLLYHSSIAPLHLSVMQDTFASANDFVVHHLSQPHQRRDIDGRATTLPVKSLALPRHHGNILRTYNDYSTSFTVIEERLQ
jgi:hypothetical protein